MENHDRVVFSDTAVPFYMICTTSDGISYFHFQYESCMMCQGFYGRSFGQPVCSTCHIFLFITDINKDEEGEGGEEYKEVKIFRGNLSVMTQCPIYYGNWSISVSYIVILR